MKIAISSAGPTLNDKVHDLFGRCDFFLVIDTESMMCRAVKNKFVGTSTGAGTACAQLLFDKSVKSVITVKAGPNAFAVLSQAGIDVFLSPSGITVDKALSKYKNNSLRKMKTTRF